MQDFFNVLNATDRPIGNIVQEAGMERTALYDWGRRQSPVVTNLEAVLNVLGYTLKIVPLEDEEDLINENRLDGTG